MKCNDKLIRASEIRQALSESYNGRSGRNVFAMNSRMEWERIYGVKTHRQAVHGHSLATGAWFVIHQWEQRWG